MILRKDTCVATEILRGRKYYLESYQVALAPERVGADTGVHELVGTNVISKDSDEAGLYILNDNTI